MDTDRKEDAAAADPYTLLGIRVGPGGCLSIALWIPPKTSLSGVHVGRLPEIQSSIRSFNLGFGTALSDDVVCDPEEQHRHVQEGCRSKSPLSKE